jgi:hypothetical protein
MSFALKAVGVAGVVGAVALTLTFTRPPIIGIQKGYRGTGLP